MVQCQLAVYSVSENTLLLCISAAAAVFLCAAVILGMIAAKRAKKIAGQQQTLTEIEREYAALKTDMEQQASDSEQKVSLVRDELSDMNRKFSDQTGAVADLEERCRQYQGQLLNVQTELMKAVEQRDAAKREAALFRDRLEQYTEETDALVERLTEAEARAEHCDRFIRAFGADAESFFSRPDAEPRLRRMAAEYLTMVYDASANYLEEKPRPALAEAKRIRELKTETQEWIDRALRAEYDLAQRPLQISEQLYLFADPEQKE